MKGFTNALIILLGLIIAAVLLGVFSRGEKENKNTSIDLSCGLHIQVPAANSFVSSPVTISGYTVAGPCWPSFEGRAGTVSLRDASLNNLSVAIPVTLIGNWQTQNPVNFNLTLNFADPDPNNLNDGFLYFENSEGDVATPRVFKIPVKF